MQLGRGLMALHGPHPYMAQKRRKGLAPEELRGQPLAL